MLDFAHYSVDSTWVAMTNKVLIVEDDRAIQMAFARILGAGGYDVALAGDAVAALSTAVQERPDAVVLDLGLPAGAGTVVLERMRNLSATSVTPVVVVTGRAPGLDQELKLKELNCETVLVKPVTSEQLLDAVGRVLGTPAEANGVTEPA